MPAQKTPPTGYEWMLSLSTEGWAWEFLRRNPGYQEDFVKFAQAPAIDRQRQAAKWGLLDITDPTADARSALVFWKPEDNPSVLPLVAQRSDRKSLLSSVTCTRTQLSHTERGQRHVLYSCSGRYLQLVISGDCDEGRATYLVDPLPEKGADRRILSLRKLSDLAHHKRLRAHLYVRQRRGPRFAHLAMVLDAYAQDTSHRSIAHAVYGSAVAERDWDFLRDHVRRAVAAGKRLTQGGYLRLLA